MSDIPLVASLKQELLDWNLPGTVQGNIQCAIDVIENYATLSSAAVAEREPVAQFRKVGCSDWYDGLPDHQDGRGPYEERTLYLDPLPTSELEAENARLREELDIAVTQRNMTLADLRRLEAHLAEAMNEERDETISAVFQSVGECLAGMTHDQVSENARRKIEAAIHAARRVREGGKVDG